MRVSCFLKLQEVGKPPCVRIHESAVFCLKQKNEYLGINSSKSKSKQLKLQYMTQTQSCSLTYKLIRLVLEFPYIKLLYCCVLLCFCDIMLHYDII